MECPVCHKDNFWFTEHNGVGFCFNCGHWTRDGNAIVKPKERSKHKDEIRGLYKQAAYYYHSSLDTISREYLYNRGFTDKTIETFKIGFCPAGKHPMYRTSIAIEAGLATSIHTAFLENRITFPYFYDNETITDIRGRAVNPNEDIRYKSPYHDAYYRWSDYPYNYHLNNNKITIITEGEIKALIATQFDYPSMALPGILTWRNGFIANPDTKYIIIFDNQRSNMYNVRAAITRIVERISNAHIGTLPLFDQEKQDIDSLILTYGIDIFKDVIDMALPYNEWAQLQRF